MHRGTDVRMADGVYVGEMLIALRPGLKKLTLHQHNAERFLPAAGARALAVTFPLDVVKLYRVENSPRSIFLNEREAVIINTLVHIELLKAAKIFRQRSPREDPFWEDTAHWAQDLQAYRLTGTLGRSTCNGQCADSLLGA